jgi:TonB family protein
MREPQKETLVDAIPATAFASLPETRGPWKYFGVTLVGQLVVALLIGKLTLSLMAPVFYEVDTRESVHLVAPDLTPPTREPEPAPKPKKVPVHPPEIIPRVKKVEPPKVIAPPVEIAKAAPPPVTPPAIKIDTPARPELAAGPKLPVGSPAQVTTNKPARQVQTGGFGDPSGVPPNPNSTGKGPELAKVGTFDVPQGPGSGNGTGGSKGTRGTVASAGFGNGVATQGEGGTGRQGTVRSTDFGSAQPAPSDAPKSKVASAAANETPVSLLSKPTPTYTPEARQRKVEGEVRLDVEFTASGQVHVLRVVQGLGYGLDEAAVHAAEQIRFAPARRGGQPVDSQGRLSVVFRLS